MTVLFRKNGLPGGQEQVNALSFPSNGSSPGFVAFQFLDPQADGLPIAGPADAGVTYIWEITPRQQTGYYTTFFWANTGANDLSTFFWAGVATADTYCGFHPYPADSDGTKTGSSGTNHAWEISANIPGDANDRISNLDDQVAVVTKNVKYTQAARITVNPNSTKTVRYYLDLPSTSNANIIEAVIDAAQWETDPPNPGITWGDAPWNRGNECLSGVLGRIKIFDKVLSEADAVSEAGDMSQLVTVDGQAHIWYGKTNYTSVDDLSCDYGTGRSFAWATADKATLVSA